MMKKARVPQLFLIQFRKQYLGTKNKFEALAEDCPWRIGNTSDILQKRDDNRVYRYHNEGLVNNVNGLRDGLLMTFQAFHGAITQRDTVTLSQTCEQNLKYAFVDFFENIGDEKCAIISSTSESDDSYFFAPRMEIIDYNVVFGAFSMSREACRLAGLQDVSYGLQPGSQCVMPRLNAVADFERLQAHLQLTIKVTSDLSLYLVDEESQEKYPVNKPAQEVHFLKMEGLIGSVNIRESFWNFKQLLPKLEPNPHHPVSDWTIVDFDDFLKGNPHIQTQQH